MANRAPTSESKKRLRSDLKMMNRDPLPLIWAVQDDSNITIVHALIVGPSETPYEGGFYWFVLNFPDDYPNSPPKVIDCLA